ncbi:phage tail tube protein [Streptomyces sp. DB-54]
MPLIDEAAIVPGTGYIFLADPDTPRPTNITDPRDPGPAWNNIGHTSRDDLPEFGRDGDDPETLGTWQNAKLRQTSPDVTYSVTFQSVQATADTYRLYFGAGPEAVQPDGSLRIPARPAPQVGALLFIIVDGQRMVPLWFPRASLLGSDAVSMDVAQFWSFPITATFLGSSSIGGDLGEWAAVAAGGPSS